MPFKKVSHVIFDLDGLILDTESILATVIGQIVAKFGKKYTAEVRAQILGTTTAGTASTVIRELELPCTVEQFIAEYRTRTKELIGHPKLMPGAKELIEHLHKHHIPIAVATSSTQDSLQVKIQDHQGLISFFHHVVCGSTDPEVKRGKPAPDIFLVCASRFPDKPQPDECLVLEDAPNGAKGAIAAGMQVILVPDLEIAQEWRTQATLTLNSLKEFKPELFGLPSFD